MPHEFKKFREILENFHISYKIQEFIDFEKIPCVSVPDWFKEEIRFSLLNRGEEDKEAFTCEFIIVPFLKEAWKRHPRLSLFSHVQIKADDLTVMPDYLISGKDHTPYFFSPFFYAKRVSRPNSTLKSVTMTTGLKPLLLAHLTAFNCPC
ncbi:MAG: hypothetical protein GY749_41880 [Desulfobacteraceae bacterium]|nr:hypothetical protein [Desulfobacteraceae bacterium]